MSGEVLDVKQVPIEGENKVYVGNVEKKFVNETAEKVLVMSSILKDGTEWLGTTEWNISGIKEIGDKYLLEIGKPDWDNTFSRAFSSEEFGCILENLGVSNMEELLNVLIITEEQFPMFVLLNLANGRGEIDC